MFRVFPPIHGHYQNPSISFRLLKSPEDNNDDNEEEMLADLAPSSMQKGNNKSLNTGASNNMEVNEAMHDSKDEGKNGPLIKKKEKGMEEDEEAEGAGQGTVSVSSMVKHGQLMSIVHT